MAFVAGTTGGRLTEKMLNRNWRSLLVSRVPNRTSERNGLLDSIGTRVSSCGMNLFRPIDRVCDRNYIRLCDIEYRVFETASYTRLLFVE